MAKDKTILLQTLKIEGASEYIQIFQLQVNHEVNEFARAKLVLSVDEKKGEKFLKQADMKKVVKITAKTKDDTVKIFSGLVVNVTLEKTPEYNLLTIDLLDTACTLNLKRASSSFQKLDAKHEDILKKVFDKTGTVHFKGAKDKAIEKMILRLNETEWEFTKRMAGKLGAPIFTTISSDKAVVTVGVPEPQNTVEMVSNQVAHIFRDTEFEFFNSNKKAFAESLKLVKEDFYSVQIGGCTDYLYIGDKVKLDKKEYFVKKVSAHFVDNIFLSSYELVGKNTAFFSRIIPQKNLAGRIFRAQVKKVEKEKIQAHLIDIDEKFDSSGTTFFPFSTAYSSQDGSGWYVMPEVDDYVNILFPSADTGEAFALSSINTAALKNPKDKSWKAPAGREILITEKGIEIIAKHGKTFIKLDANGGINLVSAKDIVINADGNISFDAKGKIQIVSAKEIITQSGQSHVKILSNQLAIGATNVIVGE